MNTLVTVSGFGLVLLLQVASTAYMMGRMKAMLNGTMKDIDSLKLEDKNLHTRVTTHVTDFHTKGRK